MISFQMQASDTFYSHVKSDKSGSCADPETFNLLQLFLLLETARKVDPQRSSLSVASVP